MPTDEGLTASLNQLRVYEIRGSMLTRFDDRMVERAYVVLSTSVGAAYTAALRRFPGLIKVTVVELGGVGELRRVR